MKKYLKTLKKLGLLLASFGFGMVAVSSHAWADMEVQTEGGLMVFDPTNDAYWFRIGGRVDIDQVFFSGNRHDKERNFPNSANIRRGILALGGGVGENWIYSLSFDFGRSVHERRILNRNRKDVVHGFTFLEEAWIGYTGLWDCSRLRIGQFTPITTFDGYQNYGTHNSQMFLESALATRAFDVPSYVNSSSTSMKGLGIILDTQLADLFTVAATVYEPAQGPDNFGNRQRSDRVGTALRATFSPVHEEGCVFHMGLMGRYQSLNSSRRGGAPVNTNAFSNAVYNELFFTTPEAIPRNYVGAFETSNPEITNVPFHGTVGSPVLVDAGPLRAKSYNHFAGELAGIWGPITLEGEYHHVSVQRLPGEFFRRNGQQLVGERNAQQRGNLHFHGWHAQGGYVLTGESRDYDFARGTLGGIDPLCSYGAWELVARYSYLTLNSNDVYGGREHNATFGINWFVNSHIRFAFNYIRADIHPTNPRIAGLRTRIIPRKRNLDIFGLRAQFVF